MTRRRYYIDIGIANFLFDLQRKYSGISRRPLVQEKDDTLEPTAKGIKVIQAIEKAAGIKILSK